MSLNAMTNKALLGPVNLFIVEMINLALTLEFYKHGSMIQFEKKPPSGKWNI